MGRFCKTCKHLRADRVEQRAECLFWAEFAETFPMPFARIGGPIFREMVVLPRHVWDDIPTAPDLAKLGHDNAADLWSETMDCAQWVAP